MNLEAEIKRRNLALNAKRLILQQTLGPGKKRVISRQSILISVGASFFAGVVYQRLSGSTQNSIFRVVEKHIIPMLGLLRLI